MYRWVSALGLAFSLAVGATPSRTARASTPPGDDITAHEYALYMDWRDGSSDPRLEKYGAADKLKRIARNLNVKPKELQAAISKVEPIAAGVGQRAKAAIEQQLATAELKGRVRSVIVDAEQGHVVAGVEWACGDKRDVDQEAAWAAWSVGASAPVVKTIGLWCTNSVGTKLFSAKIARTAAERISKRSIKRFAATRYIRLFEDVKRGPHK